MVLACINIQFLDSYLAILTAIVLTAQRLATSTFPIQVFRSHQPR